MKTIGLIIPAVATKEQPPKEAPKKETGKKK